jgi:hypothetical protein
MVFSLFRYKMKRGEEEKALRSNYFLFPVSVKMRIKINLQAKYSSLSLSMCLFISSHFEKVTKKNRCTLAGEMESELITPFSLEVWDSFKVVVV